MKSLYGFSKVARIEDEEVYSDDDYAGRKIIEMKKEKSNDLRRKKIQSQFEVGGDLKDDQLQFDLDVELSDDSEEFDVEDQ